VQLCVKSQWISRTAAHRRNRFSFSLSFWFGLSSAAQDLKVLEPAVMCMWVSRPPRLACAHYLCKVLFSC